VLGAVLGPFALPLILAFEAPYWIHRAGTVASSIIASTRAMARLGLRTIGSPFLLASRLFRTITGTRKIPPLGGAEDLYAVPEMPAPTVSGVGIAEPLSVRERAKPIFYFFDKMAYKAKWTREVLRLLKKSAKSEVLDSSVTSGIASSVMSSAALGGLGILALAAGAGYAGYKIYDETKKYLEPGRYKPESFVDILNMISRAVFAPFFGFRDALSKTFKEMGFEEPEPTKSGRTWKEWWKDFKESQKIPLFKKDTVKSDETEVVDVYPFGRIHTKLSRVPVENRFVIVSRGDETGAGTTGLLDIKTNEFIPLSEVPRPNWAIPGTFTPGELQDLIDELNTSIESGNKELADRLQAVVEVLGRILDEQIRQRAVPLEAPDFLSPLSGISNETNLINSGQISR